METAIRDYRVMRDDEDFREDTNNAVQQIQSTVGLFYICDMIPYNYNIKNIHLQYLWFWITPITFTL